MDQPQQPQPASSPVPAPSFTPSVQNPIVIDHKHRPILGGAFLIIALVMSIVAGKLLFANYWPNTDEPVVTTPTPSASAAGVPADWKTYTSHGVSSFTFKYPATLTVQVSEEILGGKPLYQWFPSDSYNTDEFRLQLVAHEEGRGGDGEIQNPVVYQISIDGVLVEVQKGNVLVMGQDKPEVGLSWRLSFTKNGRPFSFGFISESGVDQSEVITQILSTFKFIEQASLVPADWKMYVNPEYTIKYPPTWNFVENSDVSVGFYSASIGTPKDPRSYRVALFRQPAETYPEFISNTTIGGLPAFTETLTREGSAIDNGGKFTQTYVTRANRDYYFLLNAGYESEIETYNRMLSTLTFTGILIKPGWTPHLSELYGFEIQYPNTFSRTSNSGENQVLALTGRTNTQGYFSVSVYRLPLRPTDGVPCSEGAMGGLQSYVINGTITLSGATYPKCIISRSNDQALQVSFNKNGYTWLFQATAYDSQKDIIEQIFSTFKFTK